MIVLNYFTVFMSNELFLLYNNLLYSINMSQQFKIILVGQSSVGKTCLVNRFAHGKYDIKAPTVGVDFIVKEI